MAEILNAGSDKYWKAGKIKPLILSSRPMKRDRQLTLEKWANPAAIEAAHLLSSKGKARRKSVLRFNDNREENISALSAELRDRTYKSGPYISETIIDNGKERELLKSAYRDHVVRRAFMRKVEQVILPSLVPYTYAALSLRGTHAALFTVRRALLHDPENTTYCLKLDVRKFFASINREILKEQLTERFADKDTLNFAYALIDEPPTQNPGHGLPLGNYTSQWFANMYMSDFDHWALQKLRVPHYIRYMDDIVILAGSKEALRGYLREIEWYFTSKLDIEIKKNYQIFPVEARGIDFIGYRIWKNRVLLRKGKFNNLRKKMRALYKKAQKRPLTNNEHSQLFSFLGRVAYCTKKARMTIYREYFEETLKVANIEIKNKKMRQKFT